MIMGISASIEWSKSRGRSVGTEERQLCQPALERLESAVERGEYALDTQSTHEMKQGPGGRRRRFLQAPRGVCLEKGGKHDRTRGNEAIFRVQRRGKVQLVSTSEVFFFVKKEGNSI